MRALIAGFFEEPTREVSIPLDVIDLAPDTRTVLDLSAETVSRFLATLRADEARLTATIAEATETLRQTRVSIAAFEGAAKVIEGGMKNGTE